MKCQVSTLFMFFATFIVLSNTVHAQCVVGDCYSAGKAAAEAVGCTTDDGPRGICPNNGYCGKYIFFHQTLHYPQYTQLLARTPISCALSFCWNLANQQSLSSQVVLSIFKRHSIWVSAEYFASAISPQPILVFI
ncbi:hypothetical protein F5880DRAFT_75861 [Lentinula raphanica]|nr:hypothetical protein F5880DRAFT_75861 [Lentinula raphanica]